MTTWFSSDLHIDHFNVIRYCGRPFNSLPHMQEELVGRFNARVSPDDTVYILGDFSLNEKSVPIFLPRLNGTKHLICGNHDQCHPRRKGSKAASERYIRYGFASVSLFGEFEEFDLAHIPHTNTDARYPEWKAKKTGRTLLCGHVHERWRYSDNQINVGVDQWDYAPVSIEELRTFLKQQEK